MKGHVGDDQVSAARRAKFVRAEFIEQWKLSQNHSPERRERVVRGLLNSAGPEAHEVARLMREALIAPQAREPSH